MADELEHGELVARAEPAAAAPRDPLDPAMVAARRAHTAWHRGASKADAPELVAIAYVHAIGRQWAELPRYRRWILTRLARGIVERAWGARFCDPDARYPICDERPKPASPV